MAIIQSPRAFYGHLDHSLVLALKGNVRYIAARQLQGLFDELIAHEQSDTLVLDLRELDAIDSTGMGLLARLGRTTLEHGRRSVLVCRKGDVSICLRSAAFDTLFIFVEDWPFDEEVELREVSLENRELMPEILGRLMLDAHRNLADLSDENERIFAGVISALEREFEHPSKTQCD